MISTAPIAVASHVASADVSQVAKVDEDVDVEVVDVEEDVVT